MKNTVLPREDFQEILKRMKDHNITDDAGQWTGHGRQICFRYAREGKSPMEWAQAIASSKERHCIVCGSDMKGLQVWEIYRPGGSKRCICKLCRHTHTMDDNGNAVKREIK